ncbi:MAG TPA: M48 family metallopeptidase [Pyrinomonadaceae bacterium]|nr:M48 family metallopeptidase [Pyrinomonadaceae bacterium]
MKTFSLRLTTAFLLSVFAVTCLVTSPPATAERSTTPVKTSAAQYGDPYLNFRNVRYTNAGLLNERDEIKLGTQLHRQATKKFRLTDVGLDRVERVGQRVARVSARPNLLYKFHVIESREINGFALPGGHIYITTGLLKIANDSELASVLAHEVGHIAARHSLKTLKKRQEYNDIAKSIGELTGVAGNIGRDLGVSLSQMLAEGILTIYSRDEEREADYLGVRGMAKAGLDPQGMVTMFQKLQRVQGQTPDLISSLLSDHPDVQERIDNTRYEIARMRR